MLYLTNFSQISLTLPFSSEHWLAQEETCWVSLNTLFQGNWIHFKSGQILLSITFLYLTQSQGLSASYQMCSLPFQRLHQAFHYYCDFSMSIIISPNHLDFQSKLPLTRCLSLGTKTQQFIMFTCHSVSESIPSSSIGNS